MMQGVTAVVVSERQEIEQRKKQICRDKQQMCNCRIYAKHNRTDCGKSHIRNYARKRNKNRAFAGNAAFGIIYHGTDRIKRRRSDTAPDRIYRGDMPRFVEQSGKKNRNKRRTAFNIIHKCKRQRKKRTDKQSAFKKSQ